jgi:hypothetical protein
MKNRITLASLGAASVALWIVGLLVSRSLTTKLPDKATDAQVLAWVQGNKNPIISGSWLFMIGCLVFVVFAAVLRSRLAAAEDGARTLSTIAYSGAVMMAVFGILTQPDIVSAINADSVSPASAGAFHHIGDLGFMGAELSLAVFLGAVAVLAFRNAVLPRWWAALTALVAVVALIGPIGWAALIFGFPVWLLVTPWLVGRTSRRRAGITSTATASV